MGQSNNAPRVSHDQAQQRRIFKRKNKVNDGNDVKRQIDSDIGQVKPIYQLVDVKTGGGKLIELVKSQRVKQLSSSGSFAKSKSSSSATSVDMSATHRQQQQQQQVDVLLEKQIRNLVEPLLYNKGEGKLVPLVELWRHRFNRGASLDNSQDSSDPQGEQQQNKSAAPRRLVCWKLEERGFVGETALHICFLLSTPNHMILAQKLLKLFPNLINDIYTCDEYFGESSLHMAIVNENIKIVKLLLDHGANVHERCLGSFFLPEDLKSRANGAIKRLITDHEDRHADDAAAAAASDELLLQMDLFANHFSTSWQTNYVGYTYWGEYPLSFAVSLGLADCYKLLLAKGADPNRQDSNGNSTLHLAVIANRIDMFNLSYSNGANLKLLNKLRLSPLTLAAKLQRVEMFFHILTIQRQVGWIFCRVGFMETQLDGIDSIDVADGSCDDNSLLSIVVSGNSNEHLRMLDGLLSELLRIKWKTSVREKFNSWFRSFLLFLLLSSLAYITRFNVDRPLPWRPETTNERPNRTSGNVSGSDPFSHWNQLVNRVSELLLICYVVYFLWIILVRIAPGKQSSLHVDSNRPSWRSSLVSTISNYFQLTSLVQAPELLMFTFTCLLILSCIPLRWAGLTKAEDALAAVIMFLLPLKLLFFCRASRSSGSFIVMIYKILVNDVLCFVVFLIIFVAGFSQSFLIIFKTHHVREVGTTQPSGSNNSETAGQPANKNYFDNLFDAILSMHMMALNEFSLVFDEFNSTEYPLLARVLFCIYMILVSILLINMLIAMLGKTYQDISSQPNENLRQWARALLTVERMWSNSDRLKLLDRYSHRRPLLKCEQQQQQQGDAHDESQRIVRCYNSTWGLTLADLEEINLIKKLSQENKANSVRLSARISKQRAAVT